MDQSTGKRLRHGRILAAVTVIASLAAACGGASTAAGSTNYQKAVAFAQCMRAHGVPRFPDPNSQGVFISTKSNASDFDGPNSASAQRACQHLLPNGGVLTPGQGQRFLSRALRFSVCMRSHGITQFPDPGPRGGYTRSEMQRLGINVNSPHFQTARSTCQKLVPPVAP